MNAIDTLIQKLGLDPEKEIRKQLKNTPSPEGYDPVSDFQQLTEKRGQFLDSLMQNGLLPNNLSSLDVIEVGAGTGSTGAAISKRCRAVVSFELEKVHCLYGRTCLEAVPHPNLAMYWGSLTPIEDQPCYHLQDNAADLAFSYSGMFRYTVFDTLTALADTLKPGGRLIFAYPRFWTDSDDLSPMDLALLNRAVSKQKDWNEFPVQLAAKLSALSLIKEQNGVLNDCREMAAGGDIIIGSRIASTRAEYAAAPINGLVFGQTPITCNVLACTKQ